MASSDYVIVLDEGKIVLTGSPEEVFKKEDKLKETQFDLPYSMKLAKELDKLGIHIQNRMTMEGMVDELCQLHLKK